MPNKSERDRLIDLWIEHGLDDETRIKRVRLASDFMTGLVFLKSTIIVAGIIATSISAVLAGGIMVMQLIEKL